MGPEVKEMSLLLAAPRENGTGYFFHYIWGVGGNLSDVTLCTLSNTSTCREYSCIE